MAAAIRRRWLLAVALLLGIVFILAIPYVKALRDNSALPEGEIASARLFLINYITYETMESTPTQPAVTKIVDALRPYRIDRDPAKWAVLGVIEVQWSYGRKRSIELFITSGDEAAFRIDQTYYRGGANGDLIAALAIADPLWKDSATEARRRSASSAVLDSKSPPKSSP